MTKTFLEKIKELREEWIQFKANVDMLMTTTQTAIDNANKTMDGIQDTLKTIQGTLDYYGKFIQTLQKDYESLRDKVDTHIKEKTGRPWWAWWK